MLNIKTLNRFKVAPSNSKEIKFNLFAPLLKISSKERYKTEFLVYEDDEFIVNLQGIKLTQIHKDILDIALYFGKDYKKNELIGKTISLYEIQKKLNYKKKNNNRWIERKLEELKRTNIQIIRKKDKAKLEFSILRAILIDPSINQYAILFEELYLLFFENFVSINYKPLLQDILNLENGVTKAVIRYFLTFREHQINVDKLLKKVGIQGDERNLRKHRKTLLNELNKVKNIFGIEIIEGKNLKDSVIRYKKPQEVKFYYPHTE